MIEKHVSVLLNETISSLNLNENSVIVDATLGYGGHSSNILERISKGYLFAFDQDSEAIRHSTNRLNAIGTNFTIIKSNFVNMKEELAKSGVNQVDGIIFDLGVSSPQLDEDERGFSYHNDAKLDMRMDREQKLSAYEVVNNYSKEDLARIFFKYGEDKFSNNIAKKIVEYREKKPIETTLELVEIIKTAVPMKFRIDKHPARQIFQAIRIEVNHELDVLSQNIEDMIDILKSDGRFCIITFHSLEDRIVKQAFRKAENPCICPPSFPVCVCGNAPKGRMVTRKPIFPRIEEMEQNPRSKSAKLRIFRHN